MKTVSTGEKKNKFHPHLSLLRNNRLQFSIKSKILFSIFLIIIFFFLYWIKAQLGINIYGSISFGDSFPFKYLTTNVIEPQKSEILLSENFDRKKLFGTFSKNLWMREKGTVTSELSQNGFNGSRCFLVKNNSSGSWVSSHRKFVKTKKGDHFYMEGMVKMTGNTSRAFLSVAAFDKNQEAITWKLHHSKADRTGEWVKHEKHFVITDDNINFIRFRIVGVGKGIFLFDNIIFRKIDSSVNLPLPLSNGHKVL